MSRATETRKRQREIWAIGALVIAFALLFWAEVRLTRLSSTLPFVNSIFFFGLLNANLIILIALVWLVFRNIGRLFLERRRKVLGARLKTKLVIAFLAFSVIPTLVLFVISALYINSSFDKWFSLKVQDTLQASLDISHTYYRQTDQAVLHFAEHVARAAGERIGRPARDPEGVLVGFPPPWLPELLREKRELLALDGVEFYWDAFAERALARKGGTGHPGYPRLPLEFLERALAGETVSVVQRLGGGDLIRGAAPVRAGGQVAGAVVVSAYLPISLVNKVGEIASVFDDYRDVNPLKYPMKTTYFVILVMMTLVILFVAIWIGLFMAKQLTEPVERLVLGAQEVGRGNLDFRVAATGNDEITVLVESFNKMTRDLRENQTRLTQANVDIERRRRQLEAILANVGTGVVSVDGEGKILTFNRSAGFLLGVDPAAAIERPAAEVLQGIHAPLEDLVAVALDPARALGPGTSATQWNSRAGEEARSLTAVATRIASQGGDHAIEGAVIVIDDLTLVLKGQREMAWREVARRIAHEIKNPLTPIKLSAQRLQRRLAFKLGAGVEADVLQECTDTIIRHTDELKEMVNEFSNFARFPEINPSPADLNRVVQEALSLYQQAHPATEFLIEADARIPEFAFDRDQIKRVVINLVDNAVAAVAGRPDPRIRVRTRLQKAVGIVSLEIEDNGPGMPEDVKSRVFEPYFSTKEGGTGLGLAIAKRIVNDHDGFIRVHSHPGDGTRFVIELPWQEKS